MIIKTELSQIQSYLSDESGLSGGYAQKVYVPENEKELSCLLKECSENRTPVTISGGATGVTGARVPFGGVVLSLERFNRIGNIKVVNEKEAVVTAGSGVAIKELKEKARAEGWMYAPDPTEQGSWLGGNIATNASGSRGLKYGPTRNYITRLRVALSWGEIIDINRGKIFAGSNGIINIPLKSGPLKLTLPEYKLPDAKNAAGYFNSPCMDLIDLFIGQEGTLGVIIEADVMLLPALNKVLAGIAFFKEESISWDFVIEIKHLSARSKKKKDPAGIDAMSLEYFDNGALEIMREDYKDIPSGAQAAIFFEQAVTEENSDVITDKWARVMDQFGVPLESVWFGTSEREEKLFREFRHRLPEKVNEIVRINKFPKTGTDLAVPEKHLVEMLKYYGNELENSGIRYIIFGHIGESHMHANLLPDNQADYQKSKNVYLDLARKAVSLGGTVSAEHGIGKLKHSFLEVMVGQKGAREMARVKKALDPSVILCQGNIFGESLL
jgi:D-lactate dehydrogenase (cytochrome)